MPVVFTLPPPNTNVWYLAYGSNLSSRKFIHDRGIVPISATAVTVPGWTLVMDSAGVPYSEPSFASILLREHSGSEKSMRLIGTAYELTPAMYVKVLASEGGGIAYAEVEIKAERLVEHSLGCPKAMSRGLTVRSLITVIRREARPSIRYMKLLRTGASESHMPSSYQKFLEEIPVYHPPRQLYRSIGASLFLAFWRPVMLVMENITKMSLKGSSTGDAPTWTVALVRFVVFSMWLYHDFVHAPIWGKGDGMDE